MHVSLLDKTTRRGKMEIKPIRKTKLNDIVFDQMKRLIIDGSWKQGERIPSENSLAEQFGVSRVTIRQALERLNAIGLTETRAGLGRYVCVYDAGQIMQNLTPAMFLNTASMQEINDFREMLESWSAGKAAENATDEEIQALEQNYIAMQESAEQNDHHRFAMLDLEFHTRIGQITGNSLITQTYSILYEILQNTFLQIIDRMGFVGLDYHRPLIDAIKEHNSRLAAEIAREHVHNNRQYF